jgi:glyoxylase-like metal-dependent hydrolase (beta-lactamase superfamily II)
MPQQSSTLPASRHFDLKELAKGVYAAIATEEGGAYSNAGIVDLGDQTLIFDAFETAQAGKDLQMAAEHLTDRPPTYVIISHCHADHWCGNQAFAPHVPIITTHTTLEEMPESVGWLEELKETPVELEQAIEEDRDSLDTETDPCRRASLQRSITRMGHMRAMLPTLELRFPNLTFGTRLVFKGTQRMAELREAAPGHTASDAYLVLPEDRIIFMGDLGFFQCQPYTVYADPQAWVVHLEEMEQSSAETFVPGHGPLGTKTDLELQRQYIMLLQELVIGAIGEGLSVQETLEKPLPAPFDAWLHGGMARWEANVHATYERLVGGSDFTTDA